MDKADALGFQLSRPHCRYELGDAARGEDERDPPSIARIAPGGSDEVIERCGTLASGNPPSAIGTLAAARNCSIWRIRDYKIEARRPDIGDRLLPKVCAYRAHRLQLIHRRVPRDHFGKVMLNLDRNDLARTVDRRDHNRNDAASRAQLENAVARTRAHETSEQNRLDGKSIAAFRLDKSETPA